MVVVISSLSIKRVVFRAILPLQCTYDIPKLSQYGLFCQFECSRDVEQFRQYRDGFAHTTNSNTIDTSMDMFNISTNVEVADHHFQLKKHLA